MVMAVSGADAAGLMPPTYDIVNAATQALVPSLPRSRSLTTCWFCLQGISVSR